MTKETDRFMMAVVALDEWVCPARNSQASVSCEDTVTDLLLVCLRFSLIKVCEVVQRNAKFACGRSPQSESKGDRSTGCGNDWIQVFVFFEGYLNKKFWSVPAAHKTRL